MAKPIAVQKLKHGKALCGKTFGGFVDTFNWLVDFCLSLQGDKDANNANGVISVDRSDPSAPVIRASPAHENGSAATLPGCWRLEPLPDGDDEEEGEGSGEETIHLHLVACWYNVGGITYMAEPIDVQSLVDSIGGDEEGEGEGEGEGEETPASAILCAVFSAEDVTAKIYEGIVALDEAQADESQYIVPLYVLGTGGSIITDLRNAPQIQVFEGTL